LTLAVVFFAFNVFQKWRHRVDSMPFNALFIKGLLCRIVTRTGKEEIVYTTVETIWERNSLFSAPIQDLHFGKIATMLGIAEALNQQGADQLAAFEEALESGQEMPSQEKPISNDSLFFQRMAQWLR
jgi:hypothetical protein